MGVTPGSHHSSVSSGFQDSGFTIYGLGVRFLDLGFRISFSGLCPCNKVRQCVFRACLKKKAYRGAFCRAKHTGLGTWTLWIFFSSQKVFHSQRLGLRLHDPEKQLEPCFLPGI